MPKRNWLRKGWSVIFWIALVAICAGFGGTLGVLGYQEQSKVQSESNARSSNYFNAIYQAEWQRCSGLAIAERKDCVIHAEEAARENERKEHDLVAQEVTAVWTRITGLAALLGAITGAIGLWLIWVAYTESRKTNNITREIGQAQVKSYIFIDRAEYTRDDKGYSKIDIKVDNTGQSPAFVIAIFLTAYLIDEVTGVYITNPPFTKEWKPGVIGVGQTAREVFTISPPTNSNEKIKVSYKVTIKFRTIFDDLGVREMDVSGNCTLAGIKPSGCKAVALTRKHAAEHKVETAQPPQPLLPPAASAT